MPAKWSGRPETECAVTDISAGGLFVQTTLPPPVQTLMIVGAPGGTVQGRVVFVLTANQASAMGRKAGVGLQFDVPIDPDSFLLKCREYEATNRAKRDLGGVVGAAPASSALSSATLNSLPQPSTSSPSSMKAPVAAIPLPSASSSSSMKAPVTAIPLPSASASKTAPVTGIPMAAISVSSSMKAPVTGIPLPSRSSAASMKGISLPPTASASSTVPMPAVRSAAPEGDQERTGAAQKNPPSPARAHTDCLDVVLVQGITDQAVLVQALGLSGYNPLVARDGLEGLTLALRRRPLMLIVSANAARLPGRLLVADLRARKELKDLKLVLIDPSDDENPTGALRWKNSPHDVRAGRALIDTILADSQSRATTRGPEDARDIAMVMVDLGRRLHADGVVNAAVEALRYAGELAPTVSNHALALARILLGSPHLALRTEGMALIDRVTRQDTANPEGWLLRAVGADLRSDANEALASLKQALSIDPHYEEANEAMAHLGAGKRLLAVHVSNDPETHSRKSFFLWLQGFFHRPQ